MITIDKNKLQKYIYQKIDDINNPQSFKHQLDSQISKHLKKKEQELKMNHIKLKNQKRFSEQVKKRGELEGKVTTKVEKGLKNKQNQLKERVQSMMNLRQKKEQYVFERQRMTRKADLQRSLQKIKQFQQDRQIRSQTKLKPQSKSTTLDTLIKKKQADQQDYDYLIQKLQSKGLFKASSVSIPHQIHEMYRKKIHESRYHQELKEEEMINKMGMKLSKIDQARKKRQRLMLQKTQKLQENDKFQNQSKHNRLQQLQNQRRKKLKSLQLKNMAISDKSTMKIEEYGTMKKNERQRQRYDQRGYEEREAYTFKEKNVNYKNEIRKHIEEFVKKNGANGQVKKRGYY